MLTHLVHRRDTEGYMHGTNATYNTPNIRRDYVEQVHISYGAALGHRKTDLGHEWLGGLYTKFNHYIIFKKLLPIIISEQRKKNLFMQLSGVKVLYVESRS